MTLCRETSIMLFPLISTYACIFLKMYSSVILPAINNESDGIDKFLIKILLEEGIIRKKGLGGRYGGLCLSNSDTSGTGRGGDAFAPALVSGRNIPGIRLSRQWFSVKGRSLLSPGSPMRGDFSRHTLFPVSKSQFLKISIERDISPPDTSGNACYL